MSDIIGFSRSLNNSDYKGEFTTDLGQRVVHSYDNSIYHKLPDAVLYPRTTNDIIIIVQLANKHDLTINVQGGSTATVGQSLGSGLLVDCQRYMTKVLKLDLMAGWVEVEPGISLKTMQQLLAKHGYCFNVEISPNDRCTIAGMVATNAVGIGGSCFGRMSANISAVSAVLGDGQLLNTSELNSAPAKALLQKLTSAPIVELKEPRGIGGYDLAEYYKNRNLAAIFCGAEGTLGVITSIKCKISKVVENSLIVLHHPELLEALKLLVPNGALAIELLDANLCAVVRSLQPDLLGEPAKNEVVLLVNHAKPESFLAGLNDAWHKKLVVDKNKIADIWALRRSAVATISKYSKAGRRPLAMIEDTAVPPKNLVNYLSDLREFLDSHGLFYGMYGHVDAGCVHVRPALNLQHDHQLILSIVGYVKQLCISYGGVFWGEHGIGYRSEFISDFFSQAEYNVMQQIKQICDPNAIFAPGKLISNKTVGFSDDWQVIPDEDLPWLSCNGQAACLGDNALVMCPSYRASGNKAWSPKGRALMLRHWHQSDLAGKKLLENAIKQSMDKCLGCHACVPACPVSVNIPQAKFKFLEHYYNSHRRNLRDKIIVYSERYLVKFAVLKHCLLERVSSDSKLIFMPDVWSYCFDYDIWRSLKYILSYLGLNYKIVRPVFLAQAAYSEGESIEFSRANRDKLSKDLHFLEPSLIAFLSLALGQDAQDAASLLSGLKAKIQLTDQIILFTHCTEQAAGKQSAWAKLLLELGAKVSEPNLGCCGMAGAFGLKSENSQVSRNLFNIWGSQMQTEKVLLATGFSCRMQAKRHGFKIIHPLQYLAKKLGELHES